MFGGLSSGEPEDGRYSRAGWEAGRVDVFFFVVIGNSSLAEQYPGRSMPSIHHYKPHKSRLLLTQ